MEDVFGRFIIPSEGLNDIGEAGLVLKEEIFYGSKSTHGKRSIEYREWSFRVYSHSREKDLVDDGINLFALAFRKLGEVQSILHFWDQSRAKHCRSRVLGEHHVHSRSADMSHFGEMCLKFRSLIPIRCQAEAQSDIRFV